MSLFAELKRRNVVRMAGLYLVGAWLLVQVASTVFPTFGLPGWALRGLMIVAALGFVPALVFAWVFELTPDGLKRDAEVAPEQSIAAHTARRMDRMIIAALLLALVYFGVDKFVLAPRREAADIIAATQNDAASVEAASSSQLRDKSIVVLPFLDMSQGKDQEYFSDGIAEELLNLLAKIPELRVISRSSAFSFKGKEIDIPTIARQLNVANVLEGSVRKSGNQVRITVQLIEASTDTHLWSETYDRPLDNIFAIQDEIAAAVVAQLKLKLLGAVPTTTVTDPAAYSQFLQARELDRTGSVESYKQAIEHYNQALSIAPDYAAAWEGLAATYSNQVGRGMRPVEEGIRLARDAANKALSIDQNFAPAYVDLAFAALVHRDLAESARHIERAMELEPGNTGIAAGASTMAMGLGRLDEAATIGKYVIERDPTNPGGFAGLGKIYRFAGKQEESIANYRKVIELSPRFAGAHHFLGLAMLLKGVDRTQAEAVLAVMQAENAEHYRLMGLAMAYHALGRASESDAALAELVRKYERDASYNIAYVHAFRNETDLAFAWLDKAVEYQDTGLPDAFQQPLFKGLHKDPRWQPFLEKLGSSPAQLAVIRFNVTLPSERESGNQSP